MNFYLASKKEDIVFTVRNHRLDRFNLTFILVLDVNRIASVVNGVILKDGTVYGMCVIVTFFLIHYSDSD